MSSGLPTYGSSKMLNVMYSNVNTTSGMDNINKPPVRPDGSACTKIKRQKLMFKNSKKYSDSIVIKRLEETESVLRKKAEIFCIKYSKFNLYIFYSYRRLPA